MRFDNNRYDRRLKRLEKENSSLRNQVVILEAENKRFRTECQKMYDSFDKVSNLEVLYNTEINRVKEIKENYLKETRKFIALKNDYAKTMEKFLKTLK